MLIAAWNLAISDGKCFEKLLWEMNDNTDPLEKLRLLLLTLFECIWLTFSGLFFFFFAEMLNLFIKRKNVYNTEYLVILQNLQKTWRENCQIWLTTWFQTQRLTQTWIKSKGNLKGYWNYNKPLVNKQKKRNFFTFLTPVSRLN